MRTKTCSKCGEAKPISRFSPNGKRKGVQLYRSACRQCNNEMAKANRTVHLQRVNELRRENYHRQRADRVSKRHFNPVVDGRKKCPRCGETKVVDDFAKSSKSLYHSWCRRCVRDLHLREKYGISVDEYDRLFALQRGLCAVCGRPEKAGKRLGFSESRSGSRLLSVDHDHGTGKVRALLCDACNRGIGHLGDDPLRLRAAADYIERFRN